MKKGLILDMDGVIVDSERVYIQAFKEWFLDHGIELETKDFEKVIGTPYADAIDYFMEFWGDKSSREVFEEEFTRMKDSVTFDYREILNPGVDELLTYCKKRDIKTTLASGNSMDCIKKMLADCGLEEHFDFVISGERLTRNKPHPDVYLKAMEYMELEPEQCITLEDSKIGIRASKNAGIFTVAKVPEAYCLEQGEADTKVNHIEEVISMLKDA
ncbi:HAD family hydrolase [Anaerostipes sp.]|uniref:HAD family hydrolase n=1 Tax=Anaerostipes sp. TaxID=1872530 RepID=UPI0025BA866B|nr:HAD family phosphatase [Anaerostipes sp.]MBS7007837.1 HAD family phosphatase [Anaerostipes sp.]